MVHPSELSIKLNWGVFENQFKHLGKALHFFFFFDTPERFIVLLCGGGHPVEAGSHQQTGYQDLEAALLCQ